MLLSDRNDPSALFAGGATLDAPFRHVFRFHGDKMVMFQQYTDTAQWK